MSDFQQAAAPHANREKSEARKKKEKEGETERERERGRGGRMHGEFGQWPNRRHEVRRASSRGVPSCHDAWRRDVVAQMRLSVPRIVVRVSARRSASRVPPSFFLLFYFPLVSVGCLLLGAPRDIETCVRRPSRLGL